MGQHAPRLLPDRARVRGRRWYVPRVAWHRGRRIDLGAVLVVVAAVAMALRYVGLATSPPGFWTDEALASAQVVCLAFTGADVSGAPWPLVSVWHGPHTSYIFPAVFLYPGVAWVRVFGDSIAAMRALEVTWSLVTVVATAGVARSFLGRRAFAWALLLGAFSPWGWTLGRVAFGQAATTATALFMTGLWLLTIGGLRRRPGRVPVILGALAWGLSLSFNYTRVSVALVGIVLVVVLLRRRLWSWRLAALGTLGVVVGLLPTLGALADGDALSRAASVSILDPVWRQANGIDTTADLAGVFLRNVAAHLDPWFLLVNGDGNLRHSTQLSGLLSRSDVLLLLLAPVAAWLVVRRRVSVDVPRAYLALLGVGILSGFATAALTFDSLPHANRSLASQPFVVLGLSLVILVVAERWRVAGPAALVVVVAAGALFGYRYFTVFPERARASFEADVRAAVEAARSPQEVDAIGRSLSSAWHDEAFVYYAARGSGRTCPGPVR
jgi:hypothetical protein